MPFAEADVSKAGKSEATNLLPELGDEGTDNSTDILGKFGIDPSLIEGAASKNSNQKSSSNVKAKSEKKDKSSDPREIMKNLKGNKSSDDEFEDIEEDSEEEEGATEDDESEDSENEDEDAEESEEEESEDEESEESEGVFKFEHKGKAYKLDKKEAQSMVLKGMDYTKKTQALSGERREFEAYQKQTMAEMESAVSDLEKRYAGSQEKIDQFEQFNEIIELMKDENPELHEQIFDYFKQAGRNYRNPQADRKLRLLEQEIAELKKGRQSNDKESLSAEYAKEMSTIQKSIAPQLKELGLKPNWDKVKDKWTSSGGSLMDAFYSVYGPTITKLYNSKSKVSKVSNDIKNRGQSISKSSTRMKSRGELGGADLRKMGWQELADRLSAG